ncbi:GNAT family N-acetyltransferase [Gorillibacterium sp. sgz5001074]|uniref:GNAT family N-acetyltransferase n=1 Tax=Gorillibacterium sp. sgz5001074 TaxID=3446695 RepID=UPI003F67BEA5
MIRHGLTIPKHMNERQLIEVRELARVCDAAEGIELKLNWSMLEKRPDGEPNDFLWYENGRLVGFLALYHFNPNEAEAGGMVHPGYRRTGIFRALLERAMESARRQRVPKILFVCPHRSESAQRFLKAAGAVFTVSEFGMKLEEMPKPEAAAGPGEAGQALVHLRRAGPEDRELMIRLDSGGFEMSEADGVSLVEMILATPEEEWPYIAYTPEGEPVGRINIHTRDRNAHFFGFSVLPQHRRKGYGRRILTEAIRIAAAYDLRSMSLEVACENHKAMELYHSCGFRENYVNDYYKLDVR